MILSADVALVAKYVIEKANNIWVIHFIEESL